MSKHTEMNEIIKTSNDKILELEKRIETIEDIQQSILNILKQYSKRMDILRELISFIPSDNKT